MNSYRYSGNIKSGLFILGIILIIGLLTYTRQLIDELRDDNREIVRLYAEIIANTVKDENDTNLDFVFDNIIRKVFYRTRSIRIRISDNLIYSFRIIILRNV